MNKKAQSSLDIIRIGFIRFALIVIALIFVILVISILVVEDVGVEQLNNQLFIERSLSSADCLAFSEEGRVYSNIIDLSRFEPSTLQACMDAGDKKAPAAKIAMTNLDDPTRNNLLYYNEEEFIKWDPFTFDENVYLKTIKQRYVLIHSGDKLMRGKIEFEVISPVE